MLQTKPLALRITPLIQQQPLEEEEEKMQMKGQRDGSTAVADTSNLQGHISSIKGGGLPLSQAERSFFEPRFGCDFSRVRIHKDSRAADTASAVNAQAFTYKNNIVFGSGKYSPHSESGKQLLAHELTHVVQQKSRSNIKLKSYPSPLKKESISSSRQSLQVANKSNMIQRRRLPPNTEVTGLVSPGASGSAAHRAGLARLVRRSMAELTSAQRTAVATRARGALTLAQFSALPVWRRNELLAQAIYALRPDLRHGDPRLFLTGPRPGLLGIQDRLNTAMLVSLANIYFMLIASRIYDTSIGQVFGVGNINAVRTNYANAQRRLNILFSQNKIVTDRSGYAEDVGLGGLTNSTRIMVSPGTIDHPANIDSIITIIHESMHAGNSTIGDDGGYIGNPLLFTRKPESVKLHNAAHYEVVVWRILAPTHASAYTGQTFIPAGTTVGGVTAPPLTATQQGVDDAKQTFRKAWSTGLDLAEIYMDVNVHPARWTVPLTTLGYSGVPANARFSNTLPYWSKVERLTIHQRGRTISPTSANVSRRPVTRIDVALSEGVGRKLSTATAQLPQNQAVAQTFIHSHTTASQRLRIAGNARRIRNLLLRLVLRHRVGQITGNTGRDLRVVKRLAWADRWSRILRPRNPNTFP